MRRPLLLMAAFCWGASSWAAHADQDISGTYVGHGVSGAFILQMVGTPDGRVTGRYEQVELHPDGKIADVTSAVTGADDAGTVVLTIVPTVTWPATVTASGTLVGDLLHLDGSWNGGSLVLNLYRRPPSDFQAQVASLRNRSVQLTLARATSEAAAHAENLIQRQDTYVLSADTRLAKFPAFVQRYGEITAAMENGLAQELSINGGGQASVARGQLSVSINQAAVQSTQMHFYIEGIYADFDANTARLVRDSIDTTQGCHSAHVATPESPVPREREVWNAVCLHLVTSTAEFRRRVDLLLLAFKDAEGVWREQNQQQDEIVRASDAAVG